MNITEEKRRDLELILSGGKARTDRGAALAAQYLQLGEVKSKELEALGLKFKGDDTPPSGNDDVARAGVAALAQSQKDFEANVTEQLQQMAKGIETLLATLTPGDKAAPQQPQTPPAPPSDAERLASLERAFKEMTQMQPRGISNPANLVQPNDPYLNFLQTKQKEQEAPVGGLFGDVFKQAGFETPTPSGDGK